MEWRFVDELPIYTQLIGKIELAIASGEFSPGQRLPPVRELAAQAGVNPNTMQRALQELERKGLVYSQRTSGRFVTEDAAAIAAVRRGLAEHRVRELLAAMEQLGYDSGEIVSMIKEVEDERHT